jgi:hypothetical protein
MAVKELSTRRFGIEIEFKGGGTFRLWAQRLLALFRQRYPTRAFAAHDHYGHSDGGAWELKRDGSVNMGMGFELVSPAITWADWPEVMAVLSLLNQHGAQVDASCGLHVHHEVADFTAPSLRRLALVWGAAEKSVQRTVAPERVRNSYCSPFRMQHESWTQFASDVSEQVRLRRRVRGCGRRLALNLTNWWRRGVIEVRLHHGTLAEDDIRWWVLFTQNLVELSRRRLRRTTIDRLEQQTIPAQLTTLSQMFITYNDHEWVVDMATRLRDRVQTYRPDTFHAPDRDPSTWAERLYPVAPSNACLAIS